MKLIEAPKYKEVDFHGNKLTVPNDVKHLAANGDGEIVGFDDKPEPSWGRFWELFSEGDYHDQGLFLGYVDLEGMDWRDTLVEV